jgi:site-specific recombinase XerD
MSALRYRMIEDMRLAGLSEETRRAYTRAVRQLAAHYRRPPNQLSEEDVRTYLLALLDQGVARGTFKSVRFGLQFFYRQTLGLDWFLFSGKKNFVFRTRSGFPKLYLTTRSAACLAA